MEVTPERLAELVTAEAELKRTKERKSLKRREGYELHKDDIKARYAQTKDQRKAYYEANKDRILAQQRAKYYERKAVIVLAPVENNNTH